MEVRLAGTELQTTKLGYGCANLMGRLSRSESRRLLEVALDAGIRHFDTAPLYGYGACEGLFGEFVRGRRDHVTIATKFGIRPPKRSIALSAAKSAARAVVTLFPQLRRHVRRRAEQMTRGGCFTVEELTSSLQHSLRELRTDYIDVLFMHEISAEQITPELIDALENARHRGLIRYYGAATTVKDTLAIRSRQIPAGQIAQFPSSVFENVLEQLPNRNGSAIITHSSLGQHFKALSAKLAADGALRKTWSRELGFDCSDVRNVGALLLQAAMKENDGGIVLFASVNQRNIRRNAALMGAEKFSDGQVSTVTSLVLDFLGRRNPAEIELAS
jgi:D-threo-aldose 1-dehydrogenase